MKTDMDLRGRSGLVIAQVNGLLNLSKEANLLAQALIQIKIHKESSFTFVLTIYVCKISQIVGEDYKYITALYINKTKASNSIISFT